MSRNIHVTGNDIFEFLDARSRSLLAQYQGSSLNQDQILYLMNLAAMEGLRYGSNLAMSTAQAIMAVESCRLEPPLKD